MISTLNSLRPKMTWSLTCACRIAKVTSGDQPPFDQCMSKRRIAHWQQITGITSTKIFSPGCPSIIPTTGKGPLEWKMSSRPLLLLDFSSSRARPGQSSFAEKAPWPFSLRFFVANRLEEVLGFRWPELTPQEIDYRSASVVAAIDLLTRTHHE